MIFDDEPEEDFKVVSASFNVQSGIVVRVLREVDVILHSLSRCFFRSSLSKIVANHTIFR
jgi:hypothetical protein